MRFRLGDEKFSHGLLDSALDDVVARPKRSRGILGGDEPEVKISCACLSIYRVHQSDSIESETTSIMDLKTKLIYW